MTYNFENIVKGLGEGFAIFNFKEDFVFANDTACSIFDVEDGGLEGRNLKDFIDEVEWTKITKETISRREGKSNTYELKINSEKNERKIILATASPEFDQNGKIVRTVAIFRDITRRINEREQLKNMNKDMEELHHQLFTQTLETELKSKKIEKYSQELNEHKQEIDSAYEILNQSITYAKAVQDSLFPTYADLKVIFPGDFFIINKPKHIIGGDFYYVTERENYVIFAVADCTGHGVSGALITMLGITFLNDIIDRNLLMNSAEILDKLREKVKKAFQAYGHDLNNMNGMDIAFCIADKKTNILQFSGAFNPLYIVRNKNLTEYKATKNPIGYYPHEKEFDSHQINLQKGDNIYLCSDGFSDQTGGDENRKFTRAKLRSLLTEISSFSCSQQKERIENNLTEWKGKNNQIDDITIMGVKWEL
jgi:PAS domain S-box-containing protein